MAKRGRKHKVGHKKGHKGSKVTLHPTLKHMSHKGGRKRHGGKKK
jgi:hypothetical protein